MQPGTGSRFDVFTQTGQSQEEEPGDTEEGDGGPRRRVHHEATHGTANPDEEDDRPHREGQQDLQHVFRTVTSFFGHHEEEEGEEQQLHHQSRSTTSWRRSSTSSTTTTRPI